jgi:hypothetical protein
VDRCAALLVVACACACGRLEFDKLAIWEELDGSATGGGVSRHGVVARNVSLAVDPAGAVYVAWASELTGTLEVYTRVWDGGWYELGSSASGSGVSALGVESRGAAIIVPEPGRPALTWMMFDGARSIYQRVWDGSAWQERAGSASGRGISQANTPWWPSAATIGNGPVVAYEVYAVPGVSGAAHVRELGDAGWQQIDGSATGAGVASGAGAVSLVEVETLASGEIAVAWEDRRGGEKDVEVALHGTGGWRGVGGSRDVGGISRSAVPSQFPALLDTPRGPVVAWSEAGEHVYLRRLEGETWVELAGSASGAGVSGTRGPATHVALALDATGSLVVAWDGSDVHVARYDEDARAWQSLDRGELTPLDGHADNPQLATGPDGTLYLAWEQEVAQGVWEIHLRAYR